MYILYFNPQSCNAAQPVDCRCEALWLIGWVVRGKVPGEDERIEVYNHSLSFIYTSTHSTIRDNVYLKIRPVLLWYDRARVNQLSTVPSKYLWAVRSVG